MLKKGADPNIKCNPIKQIGEDKAQSPKKAAQEGGYHELEKIIKLSSDIKSGKRKIAIAVGLCVASAVGAYVFAFQGYADKLLNGGIAGADVIKYASFAPAALLLVFAVSEAITTLLNSKEFNKICQSELEKADNSKQINQTTLEEVGKVEEVTKTTQLSR